MKISPQTIERIQHAIDIVEVVGDFVPLKKKGQSYTACCPFHNEKSPSFYVTPSKGIFKCFGCGKAGDAITFVQELEGFSFVEALRYLGKRYGIEVEEEEYSPEQQQQQTEKESLHIVLNYAKNYYKDLLHNNDQGRGIGLSYFLERGFTLPTIEKFELGYCLDEWSGLLDSATGSGYQIEYLEKAGLILKKENEKDPTKTRYYDRFRGRVIFPVHHLNGKVIAFGARILKADKTQPKYINSPETEVYHKSQVLYGMYQAKNAIRNANNCYLVEGYTDVISLHQAGVENVVASSGTSLTEEQIKLIKRYTPNITVLYDGDPAGIKASIRGIDMILEQGMNVSVVLFPDNDDPDSYVRKIGGTKFVEYIQQARKDFITFKTELFLAEAGNDPMKKAGVIREIVESIARIPDAIQRAVFFRQCSTLLDIDEQTLISEYNKIQITKKREGNKQQLDDFPPDDLFADDFVETKLPVVATESDRLTNMVRSHERGIVRLLLTYSTETVDQDLSMVDFLLSNTSDIEFQTPSYKRIMELAKEEYEKGNSINESFFLSYGDEELKKEVIDVISSRYEVSDRWEKYSILVPTDQQMLDTLTPRAILRLKRVAIRCMLQDNMKQLREASEIEETTRLLTSNRELKKVSDLINQQLGIVVG